MPGRIYSKANILKLFRSFHEVLKTASAIELRKLFSTATAQLSPHGHFWYNDSIRDIPRVVAVLESILTIFPEYVLRLSPNKVK